MKIGQIGTCENCRFWERDDTDAMRRIGRPLIDDRGNTIWPETTSDDWCGEFQLKETSND